MSNMMISITVGALTAILEIIINKKKKNIDKNNNINSKNIDNNNDDNNNDNNNNNNNDKNNINNVNNHNVLLVFTSVTVKIVTVTDTK